MVRFLLATFFIGIWALVFSKESQPEIKEWQNESLQYFGYGSVNLLSDEPWQALENFQKATLLLDKSDKSSLAIGFLISFGQVIAYDILGFRELCKQSIGSLFLTINEYDAEEDNQNEIPVKQNSLPSNDYKEAVEFLRNLAEISPSPDIRELLFTFVDEVAEELLPAFTFSESPYIGKMDWDFDYGKDSISIKQCKSWWKKVKHWCREVGDFLGIASECYKKLKEIKHTHDEWNKKPIPQNQLFINSNLN